MFSTRIEGKNFVILSDMTEDTLKGNSYIRVLLGIRDDGAEITELSKGQVFWRYAADQKPSGFLVRGYECFDKTGMFYSVKNKQMHITIRRTDWQDTLNNRIARKFLIVVSPRTPKPVDPQLIRADPDDYPLP